jgi:cell division protein FtsL
VSPRTAAAAIADVIHPPVRPRPRKPAPTRRRSGVAAPRTRTANPNPRSRAKPRRAASKRDAIAILDRVLRGPLYIAVVGILLAGIVFFNVDLLQLNHGIARTDSRATLLERENAALTQHLATLASSERIQTLAIQQGLVLPQPADVHYLRANPGDADRALRVMTAPNPGSAAAAPPPVSQASTPPPGTTGVSTTGTVPATTVTTTAAPSTAQPATGATTASATGTP